MALSKIRDEEELLRACEEYRDARLGFTNGCFDLLHVGHVRYLQEARAAVDALIVAINSDASVRALKGAGRPVAPAEQRAEVLAALECVDLVVIFADRTAERLVALVQPDVYFKGADYSRELNMPPEARVVEGYGGEVRFIKLTPGVSTTELISRIRSGGLGAPRPVR